LSGNRVISDRRADRGQIVCYAYCQRSDWWSFSKKKSNTFFKDVGNTERAPKFGAM